MLYFRKHPKFYHFASIQFDEATTHRIIQPNVVKSLPLYKRKTYVGIDPWLVGKDTLIVISIRPTATVKDLPNQPEHQIQTLDLISNRVMNASYLSTCLLKLNPIAWREEEFI